MRFPFFSWNTLYNVQWHVKFGLSDLISYPSRILYFFQLIPSSFVVPDGQGFYFQYNLFGNNVSSDVFSDMLQPNFSPERASVRINSQLQIIRAFLQNFPGIKVSADLKCSLFGV
jgi:hypothetical protein